jgi:hypothetical protein
VISDEDELLAEALGELGGRAGGRAGTQYAARKLRKNVLELELSVTSGPAATAKGVEEVVRHEGRLVRAERGHDNSTTEVVGIVGAGFGNLNPAVVTVTVGPSGDGSLLTVRGAAKEGLIKQRAGEAAARRIADALTGRLDAVLKT